MARTQESRRFYIDQGDNQAIIRTVPVRRGESSPQADPTPATHTFTVSSPVVDHRRHLGFRSRRMSQIIRTARRRSHHPVS